MAYTTPVLLHGIRGNAGTPINALVGAGSVPFSMQPVGGAGIVSSDIAEDMNGSARLDGNADYFYLPDGTPFAVGVSDFCLDFWIRLNALPGSDSWPSDWSNHACPFSYGYPSSATGCGVVIGHTNIMWNDNDPQRAAGPHMLSVGEFAHCAVTRQGGTLRTFTKGKLRGQATGVTTSYSYPTPAWIGGETGQGAWVNGDIAFVRLRVGEAIWTEDFTPEAMGAGFPLLPGVGASVMPPAFVLSALAKLPGVESDVLPQARTHTPAFSGAGRIVGTVKEKATPTNKPLVRRVSLFTQKGNTFVGSVWSSADGSYEFTGVDLGQKFFTVSHDPDGVYNGVIADYITPEKIT